LLFALSLVTEAKPVAMNGQALSVRTPTVTGRTAKIILIAMFTGARRESIVKLRIYQVVPMTVRGIPCLHFGDKSLAGIRYVPIHSELQPIIDRLVAGAKDGFLFDEHARGNNENSQGDRLGKICTRLKQGLDFPKNLVFHSTRHTVAERLKENGCSDPTLQDILGHKNPGITAGYMKKATPEMMLPEIEKLVY
jgi:integrase